MRLFHISPKSGKRREKTITFNWTTSIQGYRILGLENGKLIHSMFGIMINTEFKTNKNRMSLVANRVHLCAGDWASENSGPENYKLNIWWYLLELVFATKTPRSRMY